MGEVTEIGPFTEAVTAIYFRLLGLIQCNGLGTFRF